jgi:hypothetical protein
MRELIDLFIGEIIIAIGMIILIVGIMQIIRLFARHSRGLA